MNRTEFQELAEVRIKEAEALLAAGLWDGAYYLAGYAVECALKACIAKLTKAEDFPPDKKAIEQCYTHNLATLLKAAQRDSLFADATDPKRSPTTADTVLGKNWDIVKTWSEQARYERKDETKARELVAAINDPNHGVWPWLKMHW